MAASAESFDNCQSSSSIRSFRTLPHLAQPERICGGPGANSFSPVSFRGKLFFSVIKNTCAVCFSGALSLNMIRFRLTSPFLSGHPPAPGGISPPSVQDYPGCHLLPQLRNTQFWHSVTAQQGLSRKMPVYFTQAAFSIQAPITQREKKPCMQTMNDSPTISPFLICLHIKSSHFSSVLSKNRSEKVES